MGKWTQQIESTGVVFSNYTHRSLELSVCSFFFDYRSPTKKIAVHCSGPLGEHFFCFVTEKKHRINKKIISSQFMRFFVVNIVNQFGHYFTSQKLPTTWEVVWHLIGLDRNSYHWAKKVGADSGFRRGHSSIFADNAEYHNMEGSRKFHYCFALHRTHERMTDLLIMGSIYIWHLWKCYWT